MNYKVKKIDIVHWSEDPSVLVVNALSPAEIQKVIIDNNYRKLDVILDEENLSKAIGRKGAKRKISIKINGL